MFIYARGLTNYVNIAMVDVARWTCRCRDKGCGTTEISIKKRLGNHHASFFKRLMNRGLVCLSI